MGSAPAGWWFWGIDWPESCCLEAGGDLEEQVPLVIYEKEITLNMSKFPVQRVAQMWVSALPPSHICGDHLTCSTLTWIKLICLAAPPMSNGTVLKYCPVLSLSPNMPIYLPGRSCLPKIHIKSVFVFALNTQAPKIRASTFKSKILEIQLIVRDITLLDSMASSHLH